MINSEQLWVDLLKEGIVRVLPEPKLLASGKQWADVIVDWEIISRKSPSFREASLWLAEQARILSANEMVPIPNGAIAVTQAACIGGLAKAVNRLVRVDPTTKELAVNSEYPVMEPGTRGLLTDDVFTTGSSIERGREKLIEIGAEVVGAAVIIDRTDPALHLVENLEQKLGFPVVACISIYVPFSRVDWIVD